MAAAAVERLLRLLFGDRVRFRLEDPRRQLRPLRVVQRGRTLPRGRRQWRH